MFLVPSPPSIAVKEELPDNVSAYVAALGKRRFRIEREYGLGFYLYVYEGSRSVADHLQDTLALAIEQAEEEYSVPPSAWSAAA